MLNPAPARAAIREVFLRHVIGGKRLSRGPRFASLVRGATPDVVLTGGRAARRPPRRRPARASTSAAPPPTCTRCSPPTGAGRRPAAEVAGTLWRSRTVEGDLGMRWSAPGGAGAPRWRNACSPRPSRRRWPRRPRGAGRRPGLLPADRRRPERRATHRRAWRRRSRCAGTPAATRRPGDGPTPGTCATYGCWSAPAGCCGTPRRTRRGVLAAVLTTTPAAGRCPGGPRPSSTSTTCWPRPGCSPPTIRDAAGPLLRRLICDRDRRSEYPHRGRSDGHAGTTRRRPRFGPANRLTGPGRAPRTVQWVLSVGGFRALRATSTGQLAAGRAPRTTADRPGPVGGGGRPASREPPRRGPATGWSRFTGRRARRPVDNDSWWAASSPRAGPKAAGAHLPPARRGLGGGARREPRPEPFLR